MHRKKINKFNWLIFLLLCSIGFISAQYDISGGAKAPLLAVNNTSHRIQVYLVYGMSNVSISYTSANSSHQWYRYKTKIFEHEPVSSNLQGNTSTVNNVEEGYGYFVKEGDNYSVSNTIWIIDYSKYPVNIQNLHFSKDVDPCVGFKLGGTNETQPLYYQRPDGSKVLLEREFELSYNTVQWNESSQSFQPVYEMKIINGSRLFNTQDSIPLVDTEVELSGDLFARYFETEQSFPIGFYQASAFEVHAIKEVISSGSANYNVNEGDLISPAEVRFSAIASPAATYFKWKIYKGKETIPIFDMAEPVITYEFKSSGTYKVQLEVSDAIPTCTDDTHTFEIKITDTDVDVPNVFTPEGSPGVNDVFKIAYRSITNFKGWVFNRWGAELFHWTDPSQGWDGRYRGKLVPAGAYYYVIEYRDSEGKTKRKTGDINIVRSSKTNNKTEEK